MRSIQKTLTSIAAVAIILAGCKSMNKTTKGAVIGTAGGGAIGAVIGKAAGNTALGAIIGAAVGGAAQQMWPLYNGYKNQYFHDIGSQ